MIQATPFDLALFGADIDLQGIERDVRIELALNWFGWCKTKLYDTNRRFAQNPALSGLRLRVPMTEELFDQLFEIPPWPNGQQRGPLQTLKVAVMSFINARQERLEDGSVLILANDENCVYHIEQPDGFFPGTINPLLQEAWSESVGITAYRRCTDIVIGTIVISPIRQHNTDTLTVTSIDLFRPEIQRERIDVPLMAMQHQWPEVGEPDGWVWELLVRRTLWGDVRLPFSGPSDRYGFRPHQDCHWTPGQTISTREIEGQYGYYDTFGGLWQWEGGRARNLTPFDGHWNVQLLNKNASHLWSDHIMEIGGRPVRFRSNHINIEADGRITDVTFDFV